MILLDVSSILHRCVHRINSILKADKKIFDLKNKEHANLLALNIIRDIINYTTQFQTFGDVYVCVDSKSPKKSWRHDVYPMYKANRGIYTNESDINFDDVYQFYSTLLERMQDSLGMRFISVERCEADDIIIVLAEECKRKGEKCLILSPDKDFIQLHDNNFIKQYSWVTQDFITPDHKDGLEWWKIEHICLGDVSDNVPRVVDFQQFNPGVKEYLKNKGINMTPYEFSTTKYDPTEFEKFGGVFQKPRFGVTALKKAITSYGSLERWLSSSSTILRNYQRNETLVMGYKIPMEYRRAIFEKYLEAKHFTPTVNTRVLQEEYSIPPTEFLLLNEPLENYIFSKDVSTSVDTNSDKKYLDEEFIIPETNEPL